MISGLWAIILSGWPMQELVEVRVVSAYIQAPGGREILSPALVRNGWNRFHLLIDGSPGIAYRLEVAQNPDDAARVRLSRDGEEMALPLSQTLPASGRAVFRLEFYLAADAPVRRIKLEPQVYTASSGWIIYPMEGRVVEAVVPPVKPRASSWQEFFCQPRAGPDAARDPQPQGDEIVLQDVRLAQIRDPQAVKSAFAAALGRPVEDWCRDQVAPSHPEWLLRFRDWLLK